MLRRNSLQRKKYKYKKTGTLLAYFFLITKTFKSFIETLKKYKKLFKTNEAVLVTLPIFPWCGSEIFW